MSFIVYYVIASFLITAKDIDEKAFLIIMSTGLNLWNDELDIIDYNLFLVVSWVFKNRIDQVFDIIFICKKIVEYAVILDWYQFVVLMALYNTLF